MQRRFGATAPHSSAPAGNGAPSSKLSSQPWNGCGGGTTSARSELDDRTPIEVGNAHYAETESPLETTVSQENTQERNPGRFSDDQWSEQDQTRPQRKIVGKSLGLPNSPTGSSPDSAVWLSTSRTICAIDTPSHRVFSSASWRYAVSSRISGQFEDRREHHFGSDARDEWAAARRRTSTSCASSLMRFFASRSSSESA